MRRHLRWLAPCVGAALVSTLPAAALGGTAYVERKRLTFEKEARRTLSPPGGPITLVTEDTIWLLDHSGRAVRLGALGAQCVMPQVATQSVVVRPDRAEPGMLLVLRPVRIEGFTSLVVSRNGALIVGLRWEHGRLAKLVFHDEYGHRVAERDGREFSARKPVVAAMEDGTLFAMVARLAPRDGKQVDHRLYVIVFDNRGREIWRRPVLGEYPDTLLLSKPAQALILVARGKAHDQWVHVLGLDGKQAGRLNWVQGASQLRVAVAPNGKWVATCGRDTASLVRLREPAIVWQWTQEAEPTHVFDSISVADDGTVATTLYTRSGAAPPWLWVFGPNGALVWSKRLTPRLLRFRHQGSAVHLSRDGQAVWVHTRTASTLFKRQDQP